jgi:hypothetical protein
VLPFYSHENGPCLHIDLLIDTLADDRAIMAFRNLFYMRFGKRKTVTLFRGTEESIHVYDYAKFWRHLTKMKRGRIKKKENYGIESITTTTA